MEHQLASPSYGEKRVTPSRWVHVFTGILTFAALLASILVWGDLVNGAVQAFGTIGLFLTAYGVLFSIVEVLRTQSATLAVGRAAEQAASLARVPYDMRDVSECATTIETTLYALQHGSEPRSQPLGRIIRLYTSIFEDRYDDDKSAERLRVAMVQSHVGLRARAKKDVQLEAALAEMLCDIAAKGGNIAKVKEK